MVEIATWIYKVDGRWHPGKPLQEQVCTVCRKPAASVYAAGSNDDLRCSEHRDMSLEARPALA